MGKKNKRFSEFQPTFVKSIDSRGRITLPVQLIADAKLTEKSRLLLRLSTRNKEIVVRYAK